MLLPAQYQVPFSRLGPYDRSLLDDLAYRRREFTERWAREACIVPMDRWPLFNHRHDAEHRHMRALRRFMTERASYAARVLDEVRARGPVAAGDLRDPDGTRGHPRDDWGWTPARAALEGHVAVGTLAVADRQANFARTYDLVERIVPEEHRRRQVGPEDAQRELLRLAARSLGVATAVDLADYYRLSMREARPRIAELAAAGELQEVRVAGWREPAFRHPEAVLPRRLEARALLSPFDPLVWHRPRVQRLFEFDYRLEIWVPSSKRRWGYYVLPFLFGDRLVARVDLKADRTAGALLVPGAWIERGVDRASVAEALTRELRTMATWLGLNAVDIRGSGPFAAALKAAGTRT